MRKVLLRVLFILIPFLWSIYVSAQPKNVKDCSTTCFSSEVVAVNKISNSCTAYELRVSFSGRCAHALSHYTVAVPCGKIQDVWNSENWKQEFGTDPTTGLSGFKIDDISDFGDGSVSSFIVRFTLCTEDEGCASTLACWQPVVAYKASTCVNYETLNVTCRSLKASILKQDISCFGSTDGSLSVTIEDGAEPFTYQWSNGATTGTLENVGAGEYSVTVRDASGSEIVLDATIDQPEQITLTSTVADASCNGKADGSINIAVNGGRAPYTFSWNTGAVTEDLRDIAAGTYQVSVADSRSCRVTGSFHVSSASPISLDASITKPTCNGSNGAIDLSFAGGSEPFSFEWSTGATTEDLSEIPAGAYTVTVRDDSGCSQTETYFVKDDNTLSLRADTSPTGCTDDNTGSIDLTVTGGTSPYDIVWSNGMTDEDLTGLSSGFYTVTVTDANGCVITGGYAVSKTTFQVPRIVTQPMCFGDENGSIILQEPIGGTGPFTYEWSTGESGTSLTDLAPGTYTVTVTDASGCSRTLTSTITAPTAIIAEATVSNTACNADGSFFIDLAVSGGTPPYQFDWSDGSSSEDLTNVSEGTYSVQITDARGCTASTSVEVVGESTSWSCLISGPVSAPACGSQDNTLTTPVSDADSYLWAVESTDGSWSLSNTNTSSVTFNAGNANTSATFTLTLVKAGCTQTCSYVISACVPGDNDGGSDPGSEEPDEEEPGGGDPDEGEPGGDQPGGSQTCEACFETIAHRIESTDGCYTYEMQVSTTGLCRHELSHWTLAIPCGSVSNYWNSEGWKMEFGKDPTTGLFGLKVDDINSFGKKPDTFTVRFTLCADGACDLAEWNPVVAYKAGQCVSTETIPMHQSSLSLSVYPNPFVDIIHFEWSGQNDQVSLDVIDQYGNTVLRSSTADQSTTNKMMIALQCSALPKGMYYYRLMCGEKTYHGKLSKR